MSDGNERAAAGEYRRDTGGETTADSRTLSPKVRGVWFGRWAVSAVVLGVIAAAVGAVAFRVGGWPGAVVFALWLGFSGLRAILLFRSWRYEVRVDSLFLTRGVITHVTTLVPFVRIQHVDTSRSPLERAFGLSSVVVYTAGTRGADVTIPGLTPDEAESMQRRLKRLAIEAEDESV